MGIPSYFSYIIKNYTNIIRKFKDVKLNTSKIHHLMMDCNSIIYDAYRIIETDHKTNPIESSTIEPLIIKYVLEKISHYIHYVSPTNTVFITFDGVAPFAKMSQQKTRRYKTEFSKILDQQNIQNNTPLWNTTSITPGTSFMTALTKLIHEEFNGKETKYNVEKILISCSDEPGEGEHKLFENIRTDVSIDETVAVYGLDSDLIMLSIFHMQYTDNIYVFREVPEFKSILPADHKFEPDEKLFLDIKTLQLSIFEEMGALNKEQSVYDYIFMCFLLGNDFLPHFPCLNIRTNGIRNLMAIYKQYIGKYEDKGLVSITDCSIQWINVKIFFNEIAKQEHRFLLNEYNLRDKMDGRVWADNTPEEKAQLLLNTPIIYRQAEKYINPKDSGWESRYYKTLFHSSKTFTSDDITSVSINYLQGLEWVFKYYTNGCPDWKWKYHHSYPPLFKDLIKSIPSKNNAEFILPHSKNQPFSPYLQLAYVLPGSQLSLLPSEMTNYLRKNHPEFYPDQYDFLWAFCRYFWEAHPILPDISITKLEELDIILREMSS
jgi:5'-3' exonuclease